MVTALISIPEAMDDTYKQPNGKRILWIDAAKFIGIFMVAFGHNWLDSKFCYYFYSFHMPLFFILSGLTFSTKQSLRNFTWKKIKALIIPYIFFSICLIVIYAFLSHTHNGSYDAIEEIKQFAIQQRHTHLWFLSVLFFSELIVFAILKSINSDKTSVLISIILILFTLHFCMVLEGIDNWIWNLDLVPLASAFLILGYLYKTRGMKYKIEDSLWFVGLLMMLSISISTFNYINNGIVDIYTNRYGNYPLFVVGAIISTYFLILVLRHVTLPQWMIYIGMYSLIYYGLHRIVIEFVFVVYSKFGIPFDGSTLFGVMLACIDILITFLLLYPVVEFINRKTPWIIGKF